MSVSSLKSEIDTYRNAPTATPAGLKLVDVFLQVIEAQERRIAELERRLPAANNGGVIVPVR